MNNHVKGDFADSESEFYNVTLNLVVKRQSQFQADDIRKKRAEYKNKTAGMMKHLGENVHPIHMQLQYDMEPDQVDKDGEEAIA